VVAIAAAIAETLEADGQDVGSRRRLFFLRVAEVWVLRRVNRLNRGYGHTHINIATDRYNKHVGTQNPKEQKRKRKKKTIPTPAAPREQRRLATLRPRPTGEFHHTPSTLKRRISNNTFNKENDDNAVAAQTNPRVSPDTRKGLGKRNNQHPSGRYGDTHSVTVAVSGMPTRISPAH
jgi:hypothetical protein